ncbi:MAG: cadmium-translocating P-type ATPase, partial [Chloroflexales bacterium]|nr:cadmium-translocating P-type ATPase [Chloroflexales bacterium]
MRATVQLDLPIVVPQIAADDGCLEVLTADLAQRKGIEKAHLVRQNGTAQLCLHYDPNVISLAQVERIACDAGTQFDDRYRHEQIPFVGLDAADAADSVADAVRSIAGVLHAQLNYAAGQAYVAYDSTVVQREAIEQTMRQQGARLPAAERQRATHADSPAAPPRVPADERDHAASDAHAGHNHGSAPTFLPHWMQERWALILVALAGLFLLVGWAGETFFGLPPNVAFACYLLAYAAGGYDVATHAIPGLLRGKFDTDVLMLAAAIGAAVLGEWAEGAFLLFLFALGHTGEHYALDRARNAVNALGQLMPQTAQVRRGAQIVEVPVDEVQVGAVVVVRPGDRIAVDGTVAQGSSSVDQSPITGESVPVRKEPGAEVFAGTINQDAALDVTVTRLARDTTLSRVMQLVSEAQSQQSPTQQFTQRFTRWFVPAVLVITVLVAVVPPLVGLIPFGQSFYRAMLLLVAASPCALAIGTPAAVLAGIAQAARNGVLIKGGVHLENLGALNVMAFDKTGTITEGKFSVTDVLPSDGVAPDELLRVAGAVEQQSNHPLAQAVVRAAQERKLTLPTADGLENVPGRGVRSSVNGQPVLIGSLKLFAETQGHATDAALGQTVAQLETNGRSTMAVSQGGRFLGVLGLADALRPAVAETMQQLRGLGIQHLVMLTGDNDDVAQRIAKDVGVTDVRAE